MNTDDLTTKADAGQVAPPDAKHLLPAVLLDDEGYPTEEWLQYIKSYKPDESLPLLTFVKMVLVGGLRSIATNVWQIPEGGDYEALTFNLK